MVQAEYFIDNDPGFGSGTTFSIPVSNDINQTFNVDLSTVSDGLHKLHIRTKDDLDNWSHCHIKSIYKQGIGELASVDPNLVEIEYFIDTDPGFGNVKLFTKQFNEAIEVFEKYKRFMHTDIPFVPADEKLAELYYYLSRCQFEKPDKFGQPIEKLLEELKEILTAQMFENAVIYVLKYLKIDERLLNLKHYFYLL